MKKQILFGLVAIGLAVAACTVRSEGDRISQESDTQIQQYIAAKGLTMQKTTSGIYYNITAGTGTRSPKLGEQVAVSYVLSRLDGYKFDSTGISAGKPEYFVFGTGQKLLGIEEGLSLMKEGDKAVFLFPGNLAFGSTYYDVLPPYAAVRCDITLVSTRTEDEQIEDYIAKNQLTVTEKTDTGLRFVSTSKSAAGDTVKTGKSVTVKYKGSLLRDLRKYVYGSVVYDPVFDSGLLTFTVDGGSVVSGFNEGVLKMKVGDKARLIFPSILGYGVNGSSSGGIPPLAPLQFEVEVWTVK
ncbi:MAG: FKBP-type peptidyl-prolyl cis-trans isomerase [Spirosomataceae bacterium]